MEVKYTPGPWRLAPDNYFDVVANKKDSIVPIRYYVATIHPNLSHIKGNEGMSEANARLIAAAPDLLEALSKLSSMVSQDESDYPDFKVYQLMMRADERAKQAIKKALGA